MLKLSLIVSLIILLIPSEGIANTKILKLEKSGAPALNFATYNVRNYGTDEKELTGTNKKVLRSIINKTSADLLAVQEIVNVSDFKRFISSNFPNYKSYISKCGGQGKQKLGFVYNYKKLTLKKAREDLRIKEKKGCEEGLRPVMIGQFQTKTGSFKFTAMAIHLKAGGMPRNIEVRHRQIKILGQMLREERRKNSNLIAMGDFNTTEYLSRNFYYRKFLDFVDDSKMIDFSASINCSSYWWGGIDDGFQYSSLLDHILVSETMWEKFRRQEVEVQSHCKKHSCRQERDESLGLSFQEVSDHCPVVATLR